MPFKAILSQCLNPSAADSMKDFAKLSMNDSKEKQAWDPNPSKRRPLAGPGETVEFYDLIFAYVRQYNFPQDVRQKIDFDLLNPSDVIESRLRIYNSSAMHENNHPDSAGINGAANTMKVGQKQLKNSVLFSSVFTNSTSEMQTHHLSTERRTTASCSLVLAKSMSKEGELSLEISPPGLMIQANGGFRHEITLDSEKQKSIEEEIAWSLDTEVKVPPRSKIRADLVVAEEQYDGRFRIDTIIEGTISVLTREKKTGNVVSPVIINELTKVFTPKDGFYPIEGRANAVRFVNEGRCSCQYGISQKVELTEEQI